MPEIEQAVDAEFLINADGMVATNDDEGRLRWTVPRMGDVKQLRVALISARREVGEAKEANEKMARQIQGLGLESPISVSDVLKENERLRGIMADHCADGDPWFDKPSPAASRSFPSDEDIEKAGDELFPRADDAFRKAYWIRGAKWALRERMK